MASTNRYTYSGKLRQIAVFYEGRKETVSFLDAIRSYLHLLFKTMNRAGDFGKPTIKAGFQLYVFLLADVSVFPVRIERKLHLFHLIPLMLLGSKGFY